MRFNKNYLGSLIFVGLLSVFCCDTEDDLNQMSIKRGPSNINQNCYDLLSVISISNQLSMNLGPGDYFEFSCQYDSNNALEFANVHEFINFKNNHIFIYDYDVVQDPIGIHTTNFRDFIGQSFSLDIRVLQKLDDEDHLQFYIVQEIISSLNQPDISRQWNQITYSYNLFNGNAIIDLKGSLTYRLFFNSVGVEFNDARHFKIIVDIHTGYPVSIIEVP